MNIEKLKEILKEKMDINKKLADAGEAKLALNFVGDAGIGKTSAVMQVAEERGCECTTIVLSQFEEVGDVLGMPIKIYKLLDTKKKEVEVPENMVLTLLNAGYEVIPDAEPTTTWAKPTWVPDDHGQECILFLDDFSRCTNNFLQAIMQLIQFGSYGTWRLPKYCTIVLSSNPEGDQYNVNDIDPALRTRMMNFEVEFDVTIWSAWADKKGKQSELINFALWKPEIFKSKNKTINARSYVMFMNSVMGYKLDREGLAKVILMSKAVFGEDQNIISELRSFLDMKLDKLPTPEAIMNSDWDKVGEELRNVLYDKGTYRNDIAFLITTRLSNYLDNFFSQTGEKNKLSKVEKRLEEMITSDKPVIMEHSLLEIIKKLVMKYQNKFGKILLNKKIASALIGA